MKRFKLLKSAFIHKTIKIQSLIVYLKNIEFQFDTFPISSDNILLGFMSKILNLANMSDIG